MKPVHVVDLTTAESTAQAAADFGFDYARQYLAKDEIGRAATLAFFEKTRLPEWEQKLRQAGASKKKIAIFVACLRASFEAGRSGFKEATLTVDLKKMRVA